MSETVSGRMDGATRRSLLGGAAGLSALPAHSAGAASPGVDLQTEGGRLRAYMQMRGALDGRLVTGFISGVYYGVVEDEIRPLYGVVAATFARYRRSAGGGFVGATYETPFFTDLETGAALDRWRNPYTGETVDVPQTGFPPAAISIGADLRIGPTKPLPGLTTAGGVVSSLQSGQDVWMTERTTSAFALPGTSKPVRYSEVVTLHARKSDFLSPDIARVPCQTGYTSVVSWRPWLKMGGLQGHLMATGSGGYGVEPDALPANLLTALSQRRPDVLKRPDALLLGLLQP